jgi:hypothetical protein
MNALLKKKARKYIAKAAFDNGTDGNTVHQHAARQKEGDVIMGDSMTVTNAPGGIMQGIGKNNRMNHVTAHAITGGEKTVDIDAVVQGILAELENADEGAATKENLKKMILKAQAEVKKDPRKWEFWKGKIAAAAQILSISGSVLKLLGVA